MTAIAATVMQQLYGADIWQGFVPSEVSRDVQGWNGNHPSLARLSKLGEPHIVIDVGVWKGQSTITMARAMKQAGLNGCVIAVDTWLGSIEHWSGPFAQFSRTAAMPDLYSTFLSNVYAAGLTDYVIPMPQTSVVAAAILGQRNIKAAVVHVDASHEYDDVMKDATEYWKLLQPGGYLVGDDYLEAWPGVVKAAGIFSAQVGKLLTLEPPKWILRK